MQQKNWLVYIIEGSDGNYYTGITTNIARRWGEHSGEIGFAKVGAKYFRGRKPKALVYVESGHNRSSASKREAAIKKLTKAEKNNLLSSQDNQVNRYNKIPLEEY